MTVRHFAIVALSFALSVVPSLSAGVKFVQVNYKTSNSASSLAVPYLSAQTAGNLNIVVVGWNDSTSAVSSITDSKGNTYLRAVGPFYGFFGLGLALYFSSQGAGRLLWPLCAGLLRLAIAVTGAWLMLRWTGELSYMFVALGLGLAAYGLINAVAVKSGAWFTGSR